MIELNASSRKAAGNQSRARWGVLAISALIKPVEDRVYRERTVFRVNFAITLNALGWKETALEIPYRLIFHRVTP